MSSILPDPGEVARVGGASPVDGVLPRTSVAISFGSRADDTRVPRLDLNDILIRHPQATFLMRVASSAMREAGIDAGDLALVDRAITSTHGHVVIVVADDGFVCRRLIRRGSALRLCATDATTADIVPDEGQDLQVWGVVTQVIKAMPT